MSAQAHGADIRCDLDAKCSRRLGVLRFPASLAIANLYSQTRKFGDRNSVGLPSHDFGFHLFPSRPSSIMFSPKTMIRSMVIDSSQSSPSRRAIASPGDPFGGILGLPCNCVSECQLRYVISETARENSLSRMRPTRRFWLAFVCRTKGRAL